jgi:hypothetical protein
VTAPNAGTGPSSEGSGAMLALLATAAVGLAAIVGGSVLVRTRSR